MEDKSQLLKRPMTVNELQALLPQTTDDEPEALVNKDSITSDAAEVVSSEARPKRNWLKTIAIIIVFAIILVVALKVGFYTIQPIGALPEGKTLIVWRSSGEPFLNSPDAMCMKRVGEVSLLCRGVALAAAPVDRIILRLPYMEWAYLLSTGGKRFER